MDQKIVSLLNNNLRVIIPDFGAFILRQQEPRIVVFNEMLKNNDGLLLDYIIKKENVEPEIATQLLVDYTNQASKLLDTGKVLSIEGLGDLQKDQFGRITFKQCDETTPVLTESQSSNEPADQPVILNLQEKQIIQEPVVHAQKAEAIFRKATVVPLIPRQLLMWILLIVAANLVVVAIFLLRDHRVKTGVEIRQSTRLSQPVVDQLADSVMAAIADTTSAGAGISSVRTMEKVAEELRYYIVAGCFRDEINADELVDSLKNIGYRAEKFGKIGDLFAVSFASFDNKDLAVQELARIRKEHHPEAWMTRF